MAYVIQDKIQFLADASKILSSSLDYKDTLSSIARLVVDNIADFCMIDLLDEEGNLTRVASYVQDITRQKIAHQMFNYPPDPRNKMAIYETAKTGKPILIAKVTQEWLNQASKISEEHKVLKKLGVRSFIFVPLKSRQKIIGVLTIVSSAANFSYSKDDVVLAEELAGRAGIAVDNARLFSESQDALRTRDLFISMAAHELRTPLTSISGYIQLLHNKLAKLDSIEAKWIKELSWENYRLIRLINELLAVEHIKAGQLKYVWKERSLKEIVGRAITDFQFIFPEHKITLEDKIKGDNDRIIGDFDKILQAILNLLENAAKYSPDNSNILLTIKYKSPNLVLTIKDKGDGISQSEIPKVFDMFYQGQNHSKEGLGVGLFLVKNIVQQHHGSISISSKKGIGTTVEIKLPKAKYLTTS